MDSKRHDYVPDDSLDDERPEVVCWWREYNYHLSRQGVNAMARPWYRRRVRQVLQQYPGVRAAALAGRILTPPSLHEVV